MGLAAQLGIVVRPPGRLARLITRTASTRAGAWTFARILHHLDRAVLTLTRDRFSLSEPLSRLPTVGLTTTGARSGLPRTVPLIAVPAGDDDLAVIGSNFGSRAHPGWVHNLLAHPDATVTHAGVTVQVQAVEVTGVSAEQVWSRACAMYRGYAAYADRTGGRTLRIFLLRAAVHPGRSPGGRSHD